MAAVKISSRVGGVAIFSLALGWAGLALAQLVPPVGPGLPPIPTPPPYGAYVVGYSGLEGDVATQIFKQGVLPNLSYLGQPPVNLAAGLGGADGGVASAFANVNGDIRIVASGVALGPANGVIGQPPVVQTEVIALVYSQVTFHGSGTALLRVDGTLEETGQPHAEEYVTISPTVLPPWAGYAITPESLHWGNWSASSAFSYSDGETAYVVIQISAGTEGAASVTITDPVTLTVSGGTSFTAAAPNFLVSSPVPEPEAWALFGFGVSVPGVALRRSRRQRVLAGPSV